MNTKDYLRILFRNIYASVLLASILLMPYRLSFASNKADYPEVVLSARLGSAPSQFGYKVYEDGSSTKPTAIAIDSKGLIYIADPLNSRVQRFDKNGRYLNKIDIRIHVHEEAKKITITDITTDKIDNLYVLSKQGEAIFVYDANGKLQNTISLVGKKIIWDDNRSWRNGYLQCRRIAMDVNGYIYVEANSSLIKFDQKGNVIKKWPMYHDSAGSEILFDPKGNLILLRKPDVWELYDGNEKYLGVIDKSNNPYYYSGFLCFA